MPLRLNLIRRERFSKRAPSVHDGNSLPRIGLVDKLGQHELRNVRPRDRENE
jgi:hypothetical protein